MHPPKFPQMQCTNIWQLGLPLHRCRNTYPSRGIYRATQRL